MEGIRSLRRWYTFRRGRGKELLEAGAVIRRCPHCDSETPVFDSEHDTGSMPTTFTECLWCEGLIEYDARTDVVRLPYTNVASDPGPTSPRTRLRAALTTLLVWARAVRTAKQYRLQTEKHHPTTTVELYAGKGSR